MLATLRHVGVFTTDLHRARRFWVQRLGLRVREERPELGYLTVGVTKHGEDAGLAIFEPSRETWGDDYEEATRHVGEPAASFLAANVEEFERSLRKQGVKARLFETRGKKWVHFEDPDGNTFVAHEDPWTKTRRAGLTSLDHVGVVTRDEARADAFFVRILGMRSSKLPGWGFLAYRLTPKGTAVVPFTPTPDMYEGWADPSEYEKDLARIGETTHIQFVTGDLGGLHDYLARAGVASNRVVHAVWGRAIEFRDPDGNRYLAVERRSARGTADRPRCGP